MSVDIHEKELQSLGLDESEIKELKKVLNKVVKELNKVVDILPKFNKPILFGGTNLSLRYNDDTGQPPLILAHLNTKLSIDGGDGATSNIHYSNDGLLRSED